MNWFFSKRSLLGFGLALLLIAVNIFVSYLAYQNTERLIAAHEEAAQLLNSLRVSGEVLQLLTDAETGQRGYLITGDERYLEPYNAALLGIGDKLKQLRSTLPMPKSKDLAKLESLVSAEIAVLNETVVVRGKIGFEAAQKVVAAAKSYKPLPT